jgi:hypothetical protein
MGKIVTKEIEASGKVSIGGAIKFPYTKIQDAFNNGTATSSYMMGGNLPSYISFYGSEHKMLSVSLKFTYSPADNSFVQIVSTPRVAKNDGVITLTNVDFYLTTEPLVDGMMKTTRAITVAGGKIELVKINNMWLVLSPITSNITYE